MTYSHFKNAIETEHRKALERLLYEICVVEELNAVEGAKKMGIAKEVFIYWRHSYRFEKRQQLFDQTIRDLNDKLFLSY